MGTIHQVITADESKLLEAYRRMDAEQRKMTDRMRENKAAGDRVTESIERSVGPLRTLAGIMGVGGGIAGGLALAREHFDKIEQYSRRVTENVKAASADMIAFGMMQEPGGIRGKALQTVQTMGAYGFSPAESLGTVQMLQAQLGSYEQGLEAAKAVGLLKKAGVPVESGRTAITVGMATGLTAEQAAQAPYAAGEVSSLTPADLAAASGVALPAFRGMQGGALTGYQAMAVLSKFIKDPGQLGTYARASARPLMDEKLRNNLGATDSTDFWGFYEKLVAKGVSTPEQLNAIGISEERERGAWSMMLADPSGTRRAVADVKKQFETPGLIQAKRLAAEKELPEIKLAGQIAATESRIAQMETIGPIAQESQNMSLWEAQLAEKLTERGHGWLAGSDKRLGWAGRVRAMYHGGIFQPPIMTPYELAGPPDVERSGLFEFAGKAAEQVTEFFGSDRYGSRDRLLNTPISIGGDGSRRSRRPQSMRGRSPDAQEIGKAVADHLKDAKITVVVANSPARAGRNEGTE